MYNANEALFMILRSEACDGELDEAVLKSIAENSEQLDKLYALAKYHDMAHIVGAALEKAGLLEEMTETKAKLYKQHYAAIYRYRGIEHELSAVTALFTECGVAHIPLKGSVIRKYYKEPWMRTSCDIDVLIHKEDIDRAAVLLTERLGFTYHTTSSHDVALFSPGGVHLELHYDLIEDSLFAGLGNVLENVWERATQIDETCGYEMPDDLFYFYHISHMAKHFMDGGCGIKPLLDIWVLRNRMEYDEEARYELLEKGGMLKFAEAAELLSEIWFGKAEHIEETLLIENFVLTGGTYGMPQNRANVQKVYQGSRFRYIMSRIFVPYDIIKYYYPILRKHKWLTPFYEVKRWLKVFSRKNKAIKELHTDESAAQSSKIMLDYLGIPESVRESKNND
ncbi:MAG: nucleotidyltransferase family protein [Clostridia bacterium]|nr:nucleotidyltransferase family protein [Clostridia bacterium]